MKLDKLKKDSSLTLKQIMRLVFKSEGDMGYFLHLLMEKFDKESTK